MNGGFRVPWIVLVAFLLAAMGSGYLHLDTKKADKTTVEQMAIDIRDLRNHFLGPRPGATP